MKAIPLNLMLTLLLCCAAAPSLSAKEAPPAPDTKAALAEARKAYTEAVIEDAKAQTGDLAKIDAQAGGFEEKLKAFEAATLDAAKQAGISFESYYEARYASAFEEKVKAEHEKLEPSLNALFYGAAAVFLTLLALAGFAFVRTFSMQKRLDAMHEELQGAGSDQSAD